MQSAPSKQPSRLMPLSEAAQELGVTVACLRSWIYRRAIAYTKVGRCVRISADTVQKIIARGTIPALEERA
jgi:excisionase family DNA binding protein